MKWAYAVTTVQSRIDSLLPRTLESLGKAGFPTPHLFVDGCRNSRLYDRFGLQTTIRQTPVKTYGHWLLTLLELYIRVPGADRYAIFQDDLVTYPNLRAYLNSCPYPKRGYWNLYTYSHNMELAPNKSKRGWFLSDQMGKGAVGLVFSRDAVIQLLKHDHMIRKPQTVRGKTSVDGAVSESFKKLGWKEYVHNPSLLFHTGLVSSIGHKPTKDAAGFKGEEFDAMQLLSSDSRVPKPEPRVETTPVVVPTPQPKKPEPKVKDTEPRIGLVGFNCKTGLGEKSRQFTTYLPIHNWAIKSHRSFGALPIPKGLNASIVDTTAGLKKFLETVDIVMFDETPYHRNLVQEAKQLGKRVVCIPAIEWTPENKSSWTGQVDLFICPTKQCHRLLSPTLPCQYFPWPVDANRFKFQLRTTCKEFLFLNGIGGWRGRKGAAVINEAKRLWPEMPLLVRSQRNQTWASGTTLLASVENNSDLYSRGDVLLVPHSVDGTGLEPMEAMSAGMPVVSTDGEPWNELPAVRRIKATTRREKVKRVMDWYLPDPKSLVSICKNLLGSDLRQESVAARTWAECRAFSGYADKLTQLIRYGVPEKV